MTREEMLEKLTASVCRVVFTKTNGEERDMLCTREMRNIPEEWRPKGVEKYSNEVVRAFDLNKGEWRSFKVANVISFTIVSE